MKKQKQTSPVKSVGNSSKVRLADQQKHVYRRRVYDMVRRIPRGRVMTYGQIAIILGEGYTPRTVGYVMHASEEENVPWQRVINSQGACSTGRIILPPEMQRRMLEREGIIFDEQGRCDLNRYRWSPDDEERK
jgi:methylated-DNA-protein-cysteine methyltransferase-like protein